MSTTARRDIERTTTAVLLLTVEEAAQCLSIGRTTMYSLVSTGAIESVTIGRLRRVPSECLEKYVSSLRTSGQPESGSYSACVIDGAIVAGGRGLDGYASWLRVSP